MKNATALFPASNTGLQIVWDYVRFNHEATVRSPAFPMFLAFSSYLTFCIPFMFIDLMGKRLPFFYKYKIQKEKHPSLRMMAGCVWQAIFNHLVYVFPAVVMNWFWRPPSPLPDQAPTSAGFLTGILSCLLVFDCQYYFWHKLHHSNRWLYKTFHAIHHDYVSPFSWATQYLGGWELLTVGLWSNTTPLLFKCHPLTTWGFILISIWLSVEDHVGYDLPWTFNKILPLGLCGGAAAHDTHHQKPNTNYAPFFTHMDRLFGTTATEHNSPRKWEMSQLLKGN